MELIRKNGTVFFSITALGISSLITQLVLMREFVTVFSGNELAFGVVLANWLLLTGTGSLLGRQVRKPLRFLLSSQLAVAVLPVLTLFAVRMLRGVIFPVGALLSLEQLFLTSLVLLAPYCLISGALLVVAPILFKSEPKGRVGWVYLIDSIGDIVGGILFSFVLVFLFNPFTILFIAFAINIAAAVAISIREHMLTYSAVAALLVLAAVAANVMADPQMDTLSKQYPGDIVANADSPYGSIVVANYGGELTFYESGQPLFSSNRVAENEAVVHYAAVQRQNMSSVLLISGGIAGTLHELSKYRVHVDYVELDPYLLQIAERFSKLPEGVDVHNADGRQFLRGNARYDLIIVDLPPPTTVQLARFYSSEFFAEAAGRLNPGGVLSFSLPGAENYLGEETSKAVSSVYNALTEHFSHIMMVPGESIYFVASEEPLNSSISELLTERGIGTVYINDNYLRGILTPDRVEDLEKSIDPSVRPNTDFRPIGYFYQFLRWKSQFSSTSIITFILVVGLLVLFAVRLKPVPLAIYTTGFAGASLEFLIIIGFQVLYGYVYQMVGVIVTCFMLGLLIGSYLANTRGSKAPRRDMITIEALMAALSLAVPLLLIGMRQAPEWLALLVLPLTTVFLATLVGAEFPLAALASDQGIMKTGSSIYSADFLGASVGALVVAGFLFPLLGLVWVGVIIAGLNLLSLGILTLPTRQR